MSNCTPGWTFRTIDINKQGPSQEATMHVPKTVFIATIPTDCMISAITHLTSGQERIQEFGKEGVGGGGGGGTIRGAAPGRGQEGGTPPTQLGGVGERCKLPHRGLGQSPRSQRVLR